LIAIRLPRSGSSAAANVLRLAALIWIGTFVSEPVALGGFHSKAGWVLFCGLALGISWWTRRSAWLSATRAAPLAGENPATPYLVPLLVVIAAGLVSGLFGAGFDRYYGLRVVAGVLALWLCRGPIRAAEVPRVGLAVGAGLAVAAIWAAANPTGGTEISAALAALGPAERTSWIVSRVIGSVLIAPIIEELAFRGYLLRRLSGADFRSVAYPQVTPAALAFSSLAFGAMHSRFWLGALAGLAYALVAKRTGSLAAAIVAHATTNAALTALSLATGDWSLL
jgi:exosortase E/protease (VPEID-CTERM system)